MKTELVDRTSTAFRLTTAGQSLLGLARNVVDAARALREAAGQEIVVGGKLRLGVIETVVHSWLSHYITYLNANYPKLDVDLTVDSSSVLQRRLLSGELDLVIRVEGIDSTKIASSAVASYPVRWIARRGLLSRRAAGLALRVLQRPISRSAVGRRRKLRWKVSSIRLRGKRTCGPNKRVLRARLR